MVSLIKLYTVMKELYVEVESYTAYNLTFDRI